MRELEPEPKKALRGQSPDVAWNLIKQQVFAAISDQHSQADELARKMDFGSTKGALWDALPEYREIWHEMPDDLGLDDLLEILEWMPPVRGLNELIWINPDFSLTNIPGMEPLKVLEAVLRIFTESGRWADGTVCGPWADYDDES